MLVELGYGLCLAVFAVALGSGVSVVGHCAGVTPLSQGGGPVHGDWREHGEDAPLRSAL